MKKIKSHRTKEEKQLEKFLKLIIKLPHEQYFGIARILNVPFTETMSREDIEEEIKTITEELEKIKENLAPDRIEDHDREDIEDESTEEAKDESTEDIEEKEEVAAESTRLEAMEKRLAFLKEEKEKEDKDIKIQKFRTGEAIMEDTINKFTELSNIKRKNLLAILKAGAY